MAANMWKNSLKNVESDNNKILYETLLDFFTAKWYLLSELTLYFNSKEKIVSVVVLTHFIQIASWKLLKKEEKPGH